MCHAWWFCFSKTGALCWIEVVHSVGKLWGKPVKCWTTSQKPFFFAVNNNEIKIKSLASSASMRSCWDFILTQYRIDIQMSIRQQDQIGVPQSELIIGAISSKMANLLHHTTTWYSVCSHEVNKWCTWGYTEIAVLSRNLAWQKALTVNIPSGETFSEVT